MFKELLNTQGLHFKGAFQVCNENLLVWVEDDIGWELGRAMNANWHEVYVLKHFNFLCGDFNDGDSDDLVHHWQHRNVPKIVNEHQFQDFFLLFQVSQHQFVNEVFAKVVNHHCWEAFAWVLESINDVVFQEDIFEVEESSDFFFEIDAIDNFLGFGEQVVEDDLLGEDIDDAIIIDTEGVAFESWILVIAEALLEIEFDAIEEGGATFIKHGFPFLNNESGTILIPRTSISFAGFMYFFYQ